MRLKLWIELILIFGLTNVLSAQLLIKGTVSDENNAPLPFATIYVQGTTNGTTANSEGSYQLRLPAGTYDIVAQHIGYTQSVKSISLTESNAQLNFHMQPEALMLQEVIIGAKDRDPAKRIIRNAIKKRKYYRDEALAFECDVYIKGLQRLDKRPKSLLGMTINIDTGIVYLSESISKLKFMQPDKLNETMISSKVSGQNNAFSYNMASDMLMNLYDNSFFVEGLSQRPLISPLANNAFFYYNYKLVGTFLENDRIINKIKLLPKRKTDPVFSGYIYIIEDSWRIHSVDVSLTDNNGIEFVDSLSFKQVFAPLEYDIWMPISQQYRFTLKVFGFEGSGHFTGIYSNYQVEPNYWQPPPSPAKTDTLPTAYQETPPQKPKVSFSKKDFSNALMVVEEDANEKDSIYWAEVRPIPLTQFERADYRLKDSIAVIKETKEYKDSIDIQRNQFKVSNLFLRGYTYVNSHKLLYLTYPTLLNALVYNSVEGAVANLEFQILKRKKAGFDYALKPGIRYGFANQKLQARVIGVKSINEKKRERLYGGIGRYIYQFNDQEPINSFSNSYFSLVWGNNYAKLYQKIFAYVGYQKEVTNGILIKGKLEYQDRASLSNHASFNFRDKTFTPNSPGNREIASTDFGRHQALIFGLESRFRIAQQYIDRPDRKILLDNKYPEFILEYKKGIDPFGLDVDYDFARIGMEYDLRLGLFGESEFSASHGRFLNNRQMYFPDFHHFNGSQVYITTPGLENAFQLLNYYRYSTQLSYIDAHWEHHFNEFIFNKIPYVRRLNLQAVGSINYLHTESIGQYFEFGIGVEHIFKVLRMDFYTSIRNGSYQSSGLRFGAGF
ncbi:MAG: carboxypeptidase-like regulatory domain-containing protein [Cyclobacteriaceae bacterium]